MLKNLTQIYDYDPCVAIVGTKNNSSILYANKVINT